MKAIKRTWLTGLFTLLMMGVASIAGAVDLLTDSVDGDSGLSHWTAADSYASYYTGSYKIGTASIQLRYSSSVVADVNTSGYEDIVVSFQLAGYSLESGESIAVEYNAGATWVEIGSLADGSDNGSFQSYSVTLPAAANDNANLQIRAVMNANSSYDYGYFDEITVSGTAASGGGSEPTTEYVWMSQPKNLSSPNYPNNYGNNASTTLNLQQDDAIAVRIHFDSFYTESGYDFVKIYDGSGNLIDSFSGNKGAFTTVDISGDTAQVVFTSDYSVTAPGFHINEFEYLVASAGGADTNEGGEDPGEPDEGDVGGDLAWQTESVSYASANYPGQYPNNESSTVTLSQPGATKVKVHFTAFDTESGYDYVKLYDGSGDLVISYTGNKGAFESTEVTGDTVEVRFNSDYSVTRTGWQIDQFAYLIDSGVTNTGSEETNQGGGETDPDPDPTDYNNLSWSSETRSDTSPNYPSNYPDNQNVTTTIVKPGATHMRVHFSAFNVENGYDYVTVKNAAGVEIASYTGDLGTFTSDVVEGDTIKVTFTSDYSVNKSGWKIDRLDFVGGEEETETGETNEGGEDDGDGITLIIYGEDFDGTTSSIVGWQKSDLSGITRYTGTYKVGAASMRITKDFNAVTYINTAPFSDIELTFKMAANSLESGEELMAYYDCGSGWVQCATLSDGSDDGQFREFTVQIPQGTESFKIGFSLNASSTADYAYVDDILLTGQR